MVGFMWLREGLSSPNLITVVYHVYELQAWCSSGPDHHTIISHHAAHSSWPELSTMLGSHSGTEIA